MDYWFLSYFLRCIEDVLARSAGDNVEQKINSGVRLPGRGISENDQRQI
jgi:hypothetical protein